MPILSFCFESIALGGASFLFVSGLLYGVSPSSLGLEVLDPVSNVAAYLSTFGPSRARFLSLCSYDYLSFSSWSQVDFTALPSSMWANTM